MRFENSAPSWAFALFSFSLAILPQTISATPISKRAPAPLPNTPIYLFSDGLQAENIKPRASGQLLVTVNTAPELYQINPFANQTGGLVHRFEGYTSLFGILELQPDIFYVTVGNFTGAPDFWGFAGSFSIWKVDLRGIPDPTLNPSAVQVSKIVDVPDAGLLDGFDVINVKAGLLVTGDTQSGTMFLIDVKQGTATAAYQDAILQGTASDRAAGLAHIGTNGLKVHGTDLYFTNTAKNTYGKIPLGCLITAKRACCASIIANYGTITDDLAFDGNGDQFICTPFQGIQFRPADGGVGGGLLTQLFGANSVAFGRTGGDRCVLYATFVGGTSGVARVDTSAQGYCLDDVIDN